MSMRGEVCFGASAAYASGAESDDEDQFSESDQQPQDHRRLAPQPLRRMNSDSIYDMSSMTAQLPAKKGLSRYYEGKSQSFACMSEVRCLDDLRKKEKSPRGQSKIKSCKSYATLGAGTIATAPSGSCAELEHLGMMGAGNGFRAPPIPVSKSGYHQ